MYYNYKGTTEKFVLHFNEQFRQLQEISEESEHFPPQIKFQLLQKSVKPINDLRVVEILNEFQSIITGYGRSSSLKYQTYYDLLINACARYGRTKKANVAKRGHIYQTTFSQRNDISIILLFTFYQPVFYATHDQHFPSESEERAPFWVGLVEHCGDAMTHILLDKITQKIIYRSVVRPLTKSNPNHRLSEDGGEASTSKQPSSKIPTVFITSRQADAAPSHIKPMPEFDPDDLVGRAFLLPPQENGERVRAKVTKKDVEEIEAADGNRIPHMNFILDIGEG